MMNPAKSVRYRAAILPVLVLIMLIALLVYRQQQKQSGNQTLPTTVSVATNGVLKAKNNFGSFSARLQDGKDVLLKDNQIIWSTKHADGNELVVLGVRGEEVLLRWLPSSAVDCRAAWSSTAQLYGIYSTATGPGVYPSILNDSDLNQALASCQ